MVTLSGWRLGVALIAVFVVLALLVTALFWLAIFAAVMAAVVSFNLLLLPKLARRLHVPQAVLVALTLVILAAGGYLFGGVTGALEGLAIWLLGVAVPRAVLWRYRDRLGNSTSSMVATRAIDAEFRYPVREPKA